MGETGYCTGGLPPLPRTYRPCPDRPLFSNGTQQMLLRFDELGDALFHEHLFQARHIDFAVDLLQHLVRREAIDLPV